MKKIEQNQNDIKSHILMLVNVNQLYKWLDRKPYTPLMIATFNSQLYNMAVLHFFNAQLGATCSSYELDVFDIAEITKISNTMEVLKDFQRH